MEGPKIIENLFFGITAIATFNCVCRSDYNFAFGLLCFYMMKTSNDIPTTARSLLVMNGALIIFDIIWCMTFGSVWNTKPAHHESTWKAFDKIHTFILIFSVINIFVRGAAVFFLFMIVKGQQK